MTENMNLENIISELIKLGKESKGVLEFPEVMEYIEEFSENEEILDYIIDILEENNIDVLRLIDEDEEDWDDEDADEESDPITAWLLIWNPKRFIWDDYDEYIGIFHNIFLKPDFDWSCFRSVPQCGDEVYLMVVGVGDDNGIIGSGTINDIILASESGEAQNFVEFSFDALLDYRKHQSLKQSYLEKIMPEQHWKPVSSGIRIRDYYYSELCSCWNEHIHKIQEEGSIPVYLFEFI